MEEVTRYLVIRVKGQVPAGTDEDEIANLINNVDYDVKPAEGDDLDITDTEVVACCTIDEIESVL